MGKQQDRKHKINREYGRAKIGKRFVLARKAAGDVTSMTGLLVFDNEDQLDAVFRLMELGKSEVAHTYGKLTLGKRTWLTRNMIGTDIMLGIAVSDDAAEVDAVLTNISFTGLVNQAVA